MWRVSAILTRLTEKVCLAFTRIVEWWVCWRDPGQEPDGHWVAGTVFIAKRFPWGRACSQRGTLDEPAAVKLEPLSLHPTPLPFIFGVMRGGGMGGRSLHKALVWPPGCQPDSRNITFLIRTPGQRPRSVTAGCLAPACLPRNTGSLSRQEKQLAIFGAGDEIRAFKPKSEFWKTRGCWCELDSSQKPRLF